MQAMIDYLMQHPLHAAAAVILLLLLLFTLARKMLKIAILVVVIGLAYGYYLHDIAVSSYKATKESAQELFDEAGKLIK